ncbi:ABC transporter permease [Myxococcota bacterium]
MGRSFVVGKSMWRFILRRLLLMIPTFFGITLVCFLLLRVANADPIAADLQAGVRGAQISQELLEHLRKLYDLDQPWYVQYGRLVKRLATLDFGTRWQDGRPILEVLGEALPVTLLLSFSSLFLSYLVAVPIGVYAAVRQYSLLDQSLTVALFVLYSLPSYWVGTVLLLFLSSGQVLNCSWMEQPGCFPMQGWHVFQGFSELGWWQKVGDVMWHLALPLVTLTYGSLASLSRYMRTGMLETIRQDYIRTARAKGLSERAVIFKHALRNSLIPIVTLLGLQIPYLIAGSVIVEMVFGVRGMGLVALEALRLPDYPLVVTVVACTSVLTMFGILLSDILYAVVDPRISYQGGHN